MLQCDVLALRTTQRELTQTACTRHFNASSPAPPPPLACARAQDLTFLSFCIGGWKELWTIADGFNAGSPSSTTVTIYSHTERQT